MPSTPFHYVELRAFSYVTEDEQRVEDALRALLPGEVDLDRAESEGHYGDPILVLSTRIEDDEAVETVLDRLGALPEAEREQLAAELDERVDEDCNLFVTLDKQAAATGDVRLGEGIALRGKIEAYPATRERALDAVDSTGVV